MKDIKNTVKSQEKYKSMAAIRLFSNCESGIDLIEKFSLYLDLCQIIEQDKDINSTYNMNSVFSAYYYYTVICYR